ncbi:hypothetical protein [Prosthecobacter sp.]|uniref:hypothetical protein n=1 Tax=Prosthecobacter sp. TaxID=1965333 RepID=UPI00248A77A1|nr:hypothetical protein [Prosthecobacter sp.]MDI1314945.1 hypothetical protein [Prosthecobacter sp.]
MLIYPSYTGIPLLFMRPLVLLLLCATLPAHLLAFDIPGTTGTSTTKKKPQQKKKSTEITMDPWSYTEGDLYPSAIVSTATVDWNGDDQDAEDKKTAGAAKPKKKDIPIYGDENAWLAVDLAGLPKNAQVEVTISIDGFLKPSTWKGTVTRVTKDGEARVFPKAIWDYDALLRVRQQRPVNVTFQTTVNGTPLPIDYETYVMRSLNDCMFYVLYDEDSEDFDDFSWLFAAYVNENHPEVDMILKEALQSGIVSDFDGYQDDDHKAVMMQVFAVWNALQRRGIKYSDVSHTTPSKLVVSQSVRFLDDSVRATQANCVDGTVLMASVLSKIGITSYLVMIPGHCFLAFDLGDGDDAKRVGIETTMLGNDEIKSVEEIAHLTQTAKLTEFKSSYKTFTAAVKTGNANLKKYKTELADDSEDADPDIQIISIPDARDLGIMPISSLRDSR